MKYLLQQPGTQDCQLYAVCNVARFLGLPTEEPGSAWWKETVEWIGAVAGPALRVEKAAWELGLEILLVPQEFVLEYVPAMITVWPKDHGRHAVLVVGGNAKELVLVNYEVGGEVVQTIPREKISFSKFDQTWAFRKALEKHKGLVLERPVTHLRPERGEYCGKFVRIGCGKVRHFVVAEIKSRGYVRFACGRRTELRVTRNEELLICKGCQRHSYYWKDGDVK